MLYRILGLLIFSDNFFDVASECLRNTFLWITLKYDDMRHPIAIIMTKHNFFSMNIINVFMLESNEN